jgi:hypothetical protein
MFEHVTHRDMVELTALDVTIIKRGFPHVQTGPLPSFDDLRIQIDADCLVAEGLRDCQEVAAAAPYV